MNGTGVDGTTIRIGIEVTRSAADVFKGFGTKTSQGDTRLAAQAVVNYINTKGGGIAGRKLVPVFHSTDTTSGSSATQAAATCAHLTQDDEVFAVVSAHILLVGQQLADCLAKAKTPLVSELYYPWDDELFSRWAPYLYDPSFLSASRWGAWIDGLAEARFFGSKPKIGIVRYDGEIYRRIMSRSIRPALKRHKLAIAEEWSYPEPDSTLAVGAAGSNVIDGIVRFRDAGVTHVLFVATQGSIQFFWMPQADAQEYRPRYALNSFEKPDFLQTNVPKEQLRRSMGIGWQPMVDVAEGQDPGKRSGADKCNAAFSTAGLTFPDRNARRFAMQYCDGLLFLKAALDRAAPTLTPAGMRKAVNGLSYSSPLAFGTKFGSGKGYGASVVRPFVFADDCLCFKYTGKPKPIN